MNRRTFFVRGMVLSAMVLGIGVRLMAAVPGGPGSLGSDKTPGPGGWPTTWPWVTPAKVPAKAGNQMIVAPADAVDGMPTAEKNGNFRIAPPFANAVELTAKVGVPKGTVSNFTMRSEDSKYYPGIKIPAVAAPYSRLVTVYVPAQYEAGSAAPFIVAQDAMQARMVPRILDNLIAEKRVPAMVAIFLASGGQDAQGSERGLEYDTLSGKFAEFVEAEVLPLVEKNANVKLTKDPDGRATLGGSSGGVASFTMAWYHPDLYRRVISYSGTFVNNQWPASPITPHGGWEYHERLIAQSEKKPLRVWLEVGGKDNKYTEEEETLHNWPMANNRMAAAMKAKGYEYQYVFADTAGHVDSKVVLQTLPEALEWVWKGYKAAK